MKKIKIILNLLGEFPFDPAHVLLVDLPIADLGLHDAGVTGCPAEHEQTTCKSVQTVYGSEVSQIMLFGQHEYHSVVPITAARMNLLNEQCSDHNNCH